MLKKVKMLCEKSNTSITKVEKALGFSNGCICKWANSIPAADKLKAVAEYFGVTMESFFED